MSHLCVGKEDTLFPFKSVQIGSGQRQKAQSIMLSCFLIKALEWIFSNIGQSVSRLLQQS